MQQRKNYFIDRKFQTDFMIKFYLLVLITGGFVILMLYFLAGKATAVSFVNSRVVVQTAADYIFPILVQTFAVTSLVVGLAAGGIMLFVSHRIAGPAYRFKKVLEALGDGDFSIDCRIRANDSLKDVAESFRGMIGKVRGKLGAVDGSLAELKRKMETQNLHEIGSAVNELDQVMRQFKF